MIHLASYLYTQVSNLPEDQKKEVVRERVKVITRTALAVLGCLVVQRLQLSSIGLGVAVLIGAELSLPATLVAVGCMGSYKLYRHIIIGITQDPKAARVSTEGKTMIAALPAFPIVMLTNLFAHLPPLSIGILEKHGIEPLANYAADWVVIK